MEILWVILGVVAWYGIGLLGSAIGLGAIKKDIELKFGYYNPQGDTKAGYLMAIAGVLNLIAGIWSSLSPRWHWIKGGN